MIAFVRSYNVPAMRRLLPAMLCLTFLTTNAWAQTDDFKSYLRDHYESKTFIIRDFPSGNHLSYDSSGLPISHASVGDWSETGFVIGYDARIHHNHLVLKAQRMAAVSINKTFQLRPVQHPHPDGRQGDPVFVEIDIQLGGIASPRALDALLSKVFLSTQDSLVDLVPEYWKPCMSSGLAGKNANCLFSPEILKIPGVIPVEGPAPKEIPVVSSSPGIFRVGSDVSPPVQLYAPEPAFSEAARALKFQGTATLAVFINKDGSPSHIRILQPLGAGLDAKAVQAVQNWKFKPAERNGEPVAVAIAVEINFHLY
jgi:TonB family protein